MKKKGGRDFALDFLIHSLAVVLASFLFAASFPNLLFVNGFPLLAWIAFVPVFWLVRRIGWTASVLWGAFYGYAAYGLYNYWLSVFHPLAGMIVGIIYLGYFALLFPLLKAAVVLFPRKGYIVQLLIWVAYEYLRIRGFVGYAYGISGYSQWSVLPLIQIADIFGVWGVCALVVFPSAWLAGGFEHGRSGFLAFLQRESVSLAVWSFALIAAFAYGFTFQVDYSGAPSKRIALIQHNTDPWRGGITAYRENFLTLKRLSEEALAQELKPDLVVWSETAFVPRLYWHRTYRDDPDSYVLVKELDDFLASTTVPFLIGNDDGRKEVSASGELERVDYNAAILFEAGVEKTVYRKLHLVPFTEHFPYERQLPVIYKALRDADTHFWKKGSEATVFETAGMRFSTPICFEDTFGYLSRRFVRAGAELIVNITNDAWANSLPAQMQHATMAVFRAVENRRTVVRSTASGQTCAIDPNGRIIAMAEPFTETQLTVDVPIFTARRTLYTWYGDLWAWLFIAASALALAGGVVRNALQRKA
ncbi:MAG TPA: apolipoprotein N-acyltransferase [Treponema sp.]|nr:MAG: apolipoprotein N-acyltransferase [Treponema sp. GWC1_61_84]OHE70926.1 MAG: apolipoprotein N-acyltransferase [Treponema sp. RIFOXYC1_FULL_61_9]HCM27362.1 apolipoprotein N-acyltransferase [Treponema sp.]